MTSARSTSDLRACGALLLTALLACEGERSAPALVLVLDAGATESLCTAERDPNGSFCDAPSSDPLLGSIQALQLVHSQHPTIALHLSTLPEAADRFMRADDATTTQEALRVAVGKRGYPAVDELRRFMRSYVGVLGRDLAESEAVRLFAHANVSDDVLVQASQLSEIVERLQESGRSLGYAAPLLEGLTARVLSARAEVDETRASLDRLRELQTQRRDASTALHVELVALRRSLRVALGSSHGDYQRLRVRTQRPDVEDEDALGETTSTAATATNARTSAVPATPTNGHTHA